MDTVLFVCTGNQCRSPMAEAWLTHLARKGNLEVEVSSAGILASSGIRPSAPAVAVVEEAGANLKGIRSRELTLSMLRRADRIVVMTEEHMDQVVRLEPTVVDKTCMLSEYTGTKKDIPDPIGQSMDVYRQCFNAIRPAVGALLKSIAERSAQTSAQGLISDFLDEDYLVVIGSDHGGYDLKNALAEYLCGKGVNVVDVGPAEFDAKDDYPDFAGSVSRQVVENQNVAGILICTSGIGMSINANRFRGVRAALVKTPREAAVSRMHNCSNLMVAGGNDLTNARLFEIAETWLATPFSKEERHVRRLEKIEKNSRVDYEDLKAADPEIYAAIEREAARQADTLDLVASESIVSGAVRDALGSILTNKYAEGYPGARWYGSCDVVDEIETLAISRACDLFKAEAANVQPHSGTQANMAAYLALLEPGDTILAMMPDQGGHLSHGLKQNFSGRLFDVVGYDLSKESLIDYDEIKRVAKTCNPALIVIGPSTYSRTIDYFKMREIADEASAFLMADMAHVAGLVAAGVHPSPVPYCDVVTTTTHKTLRGPRGGLILCRRDHVNKINAQVFPGIQGGPLMHAIAAKAVCFREATSAEFREHAKAIVENAKALARALDDKEIDVVTGGTDNHQVILDLTSLDIGGDVAAKALETAGIIVNAVSLPHSSTGKPNGLRLGTPVITSRGLRATDMDQLADWIQRVLADSADVDVIDGVRAEVAEVLCRFPLP